MHFDWCSCSFIEIISVDQPLQRADNETHYFVVYSVTIVHAFTIGAIFIFISLFWQSIIYVYSDFCYVAIRCGFSFAFIQKYSG